MNSPAYLTSEQAAEKGRCTIVACGPGVEPELVGEALADGGLSLPDASLKPRTIRACSMVDVRSTLTSGELWTETITQSSPVAPES